MSTSPVAPDETGSQVVVWVVPGARKPGVAGVYNGMVKLRVAAPAEGGRANTEAVRALSRLLGVKVELISGITGRHKVFRAVGIRPDDTRKRLGL